MSNIIKGAFTTIEGNKVMCKVRGSECYDHPVGYGYGIDGHFYYLYPDLNKCLLLKKGDGSYIYHDDDLYFTSIGLYKNDPPDLIVVNSQVFLERLELVEGVKAIEVLRTNIKELSLPFTINRVVSENTIDLHNLEDIMAYKGNDVNVEMKRKIPVTDSLF